jgi:hypothetical protein
MSSDWRTVDLFLPTSYKDITLHIDTSNVSPSFFFYAISAASYPLPHSLVFIWINLAARRIHTRYICLPWLT